ncbi:protein-S-isoprenylcysteine O-methyltransferase [Orussus abietinus]|uniref:protein-S-isoprenylcysteine O-methyltransferase n=1 Tax=Orussus abietinus TaxID=222816 RepID=UPI000625B24E|nr:protein-S-isoprenylcysteine O-methyltransferase [Orussus abietinus]
MLCWPGKLSIICFTTSVLLATFSELLFRLEFDDFFEYVWNVVIFHAVFYGLLNVILVAVCREFLYQVAVRAAFLGYAFGVGILIYLTAPLSWKIFGIYVSVLATFHYTEFLSIAWTNPGSLSTDSFVINHSVAYGIAACSSWAEFFVERYFLPEMKEPYFCSYLGLIMCISGEVLRKLAMFTAQHNFNHLVQYKKVEEHKLVTHGVYSLCRHPSYVGWFYWSIGTQLILQNPICLVAYAVTSWRFFYTRVLIEEEILIIFFETEYTEYQKRVGTGLPFMIGYRVDL